MEDVDIEMANLKNIVVDEVHITITKKNIKNMYIRITPPEGMVQISAPKYMNEKDITSFIVSRMEWIKEKREKLKDVNKKELLDYKDNDAIYLFEQQYKLRVIYIDKGSNVHINKDTLELSVKEETSLKRREEIINEWYREILKNEVPKLIEIWEKKIGVKANNWGIKKMKTRWGSCNIIKKNIWINLQLAKKPFDCLEYVVVHELTHLLEKSHNALFKSYMDEFIPDWRMIRKKLNGFNNG